jgi:S-adenosylmethionine hydrolase
MIRINRLVNNLFSIMLILTLCSSLCWAKPGIIVFQSDFGMQDGAVSTVKGVMYSVDSSLIISDLTHEIPSFNIWDAAYRLYQTAPYWPKNTVFLSVVDPGVGTKRRSIVALTNNGQYFVTPDNGTLTLIDQELGIKEVREIDETKNRLPGSNGSDTFFGRDVFGYTAAKLASGAITFEQVGPILIDPIVKIPFLKPVLDNDELKGTIVILDSQFGNVWTNIDKKILEEFGFNTETCYEVRIYHNDHNTFKGLLLFHKTFGTVSKGQDLLYINSLYNLSLATNQDNFAKIHNVGSGPEWTISIKKSNKPKEQCNSEWLYVR